MSRYVALAPARDAAPTDWVLIRDGFAPAGFAFPIPWLLFRRLWWPAFAAILAGLLIGWGVAIGALDPIVLPVLSLVFSLIVGLEGQSWRVSRETGRGYRLASVLTAQSRSDAEDRLAFLATRGIHSA